MAKEHENDTRAEGMPVEETGHSATANPIEVDVDQAADSTSKKKGTEPEQTKPKEEAKTKSAPNTGDKKSLWQTIKGFFKAIGGVLAAPALMLQKLMLRIIGGKEAVKESEKAFADALKEAQVKQATKEAREFNEREVNKILEERMKTPEWTEGLHITGVNFIDNETGQDSVLHSIVVQCNQDGHFAGEYRVHVGVDGQLLKNNIVPNDVFKQLAELMEEAQLQAGNTQVGDNGEQDHTQDDTGVPVEENGPPADPYTTINEHNGKEVTVVRDPNAPKAVITITEGDRESTYTAQYEGGHIRIEGMDQRDSASALVAQTVYQAFKPIIDADRASLSHSKGVSLDKVAAAEAFRDMRETVTTTLSTPADQLKQCSAMFIIPTSQDSVSVVRANISPANLEKGKHDLIHMHTFRLDTKDGQNFAFETVQHGSQSVTKLADVSVYPSMATTPNALNTAMMQVQYAATRLPVIDSHQTPENTTVQMVAVADEAKFDATGNINLIACAHVVPQHDGFELQTERTLTHAEIQSVMAHIPQNDNTVFSDETYADAVDALKQSAGVRNDGQAYTRYFVIGDAAFAYDGHNLSIQRAGDDKPFVKEVKELDSEAIQDAYADYAKAIADAEHDVPEAAEHEAGNK
jgi:hypothetical protein